MRPRDCLLVVFALLTGCLVAPVAGAEQSRVFTVATGSGPEPRDGGIATAAGLGGSDAAVAADGSLLIADREVWRIGLDGRLTRVAGDGRQGSSGDGGPARDARLDASGLGTSADGSILVADLRNNRIRRIAPDGTMSTVAGSGPPGDAGHGFSGDGGPATTARLDSPADVAPMVDGGFLIADSGNNRVRRVWHDGTITTVAGSGKPSADPPMHLSEGGAATAAALSSPAAVAVMPDDGFVVADTGNNRILRVAPDGTVSTFAGTGDFGGGDFGVIGDGGPATRARLGYPKGLVVDPAGAVLIADSEGDRVRRVTPDGLIATVAGSTLPSRVGDLGFSAALRGDGERASAAILFGTKGLALAPDQGLFVTTDDGVRLVAAPGTSRLAVALLRGAGRASASAYRSQALTTVAAHVAVEVRRREFRERAEGNTPAGSPATITLRRHFAPGRYTVTATATTAAGAIATSRTHVVLGETLPLHTARSAVDKETYENSQEGDTYAVGRCRRLAARRVDCEVKHGLDSITPNTCDDIVAVRLSSRGLLRARRYRCPRRGQRLFRGNPASLAKPYWLGLD